MCKILDEDKWAVSHHLKLIFSKLFLKTSLTLCCSYSEIYIFMPSLININSPSKGIVKFLSNWILPTTIARLATIYVCRSIYSFIHSTKARHGHFSILSGQHRKCSYMLRNYLKCFVKLSSFKLLLGKVVRSCWEK